MTPRTLLLGTLVFLAAMSRVVPHPPNFTPVCAMALFATAYFRPKWIAFMIPLGAMFLGDLALEAATRLGLYQGWLAHGWGLHRGMVVVYGAVAMVAALGLLLRRKKTVLRIRAALLAGSALFFLVTNFALWACYDLYPHTLQGVIASYAAALPFFKLSLLGDACYATILFGSAAVAEQWFLLRENIQIFSRDELART